MKTLQPALSSLLLILASAALSPARAGTPQAPAVRVLVVTGVDHPAHVWKDTGPAIRAVLEKNKRLDVRLAEDPEFLASEAVFGYDVLLLNFKNYEPLRQEDDARKNLTRFVQQGKGLVLFHFACGAFEEWNGFLDLAGRVWDKKKRPHDPRGPFTVHISDQQHPITAGLADFETADELYTCLGGDRPIHVLATAHSKVDGQDYPMAFTWQYGKGRVFHVLLGHDLKAIAAPGLGQLLERGCLWAAGKM